MRKGHGCEWIAASFAHQQEYILRHVGEGGGLVVRQRACIHEETLITHLISLRSRGIPQIVIAVRTGQASSPRLQVDRHRQAGKT